MMKTMHYNTCVCHTTQELVSMVNNKIKDGWIPQGGISCVCDENGNSWFFQAITKRLDND